MTSASSYSLAAKMAGAAALSLLLATGLTSCGGGGGGTSKAVQQGTDNPPTSDGSDSPTAPDTPGSPREFPVIQLQASGQTIYAEVAATAEQREKGLMYRQSLAENDGMLFVFSQPTSICMWMKDTYIPLSVAFIDQNGVIVNITDMVPQTTELNCSHGPTRYALEMNQGWFVQKNIYPGSNVTGLP